MKKVANRSSPVLRTRCLFSGDSLPGNIRDRNGDMRWAELNEVIVVAADGTRGLAYGFDFDSRDRWQGARKKLVLNFPGDGNLILKAAALVFLLDKISDRTGHFVERFAQLTQLVALLDLYAMREVHDLHVLGAAV